MARLWHLANLNPEATRGSIAGQIKALSMLIAIEGLIPDRRLSPVPSQPAAPPVQARIYVSEAMRRRQAEATTSNDAVTPLQAQPAAPPVPEPPPPTPSPSPGPTGDAPSPNLNRNQTSLDNPFIYPAGRNWVPEANGRIYDADVHPVSRSLPIPPRKKNFARDR